MYYYREEAEQKSKREEAQQQVAELQNALMENESKVKMLEQEIARHRNTSAHFQQMKKEKERNVYQLNDEISNID